MTTVDFDSANFSSFTGMDDLHIFDKAKLIHDYIDYLRNKGHFNYRRALLAGSAPQVTVREEHGLKAKPMIFLASNDYLNLTKHPKTIAAGVEAINKYGCGSGSVPLLGGTLDIHIELEQKVARFKRCEDAIVYSSGFGSNCGSLLAMLDKRDLAVVDIYAHASLVDGCRNTNVLPFRHNDMDTLNRIVSRNVSKYRMILIIVDGVYSMDGDICPLDRVVEIARAHKAFVMVDEAHATGVIGENGRGTPEHFGLEGEIDVVAGTFSKALGSVGGFIAGRRELIESLRFLSRTYMFSTAMTPQSAASLIAALSVIEDEPELRASLWRNIEYFRARLLELNFNIGNSSTAIFPVIIGDDYKTKELCRLLHERGIYVNQVLYPAVPKKLSRIRMSLMANHTEEQLSYVADTLGELGRKLAII